MTKPGGEDQGQATAPFYEGRWFKGAVAIVGLIGAVAALLGPPKLWDVLADIFSPDLPANNTEIILDASAGMDEEFGNTGLTKYEAAVDAVRTFVGPFRNEGLALRVYGGDCPEAGDLVVDFGAGRGEQIGDAAADRQPAGAANFANAVIAAIDDFSDTDRFPGPGSHRRVLILAGSTDQCRGTAVTEVCDELKRAGIDAVFKLVGVGVSGNDRKQLGKLGGECGDQAVVRFADNLRQLGAAVASPQVGITGATGPETP